METDQKPPRSKGKLIAALGIIALVVLFLIWATYQSVKTYYAGGPVQSVTPAPTKSQKALKSPSKTSKKTVVADEGQDSGSDDNANSQPEAQNASPETPPPDNSLADQINFFVDIANKSTGGHIAGITRWIKPTINIRIFEGQPTAIQQGCLNSLISDFNSQSSTAKMVMSNSEADIRMFFVPPSEVRELSSDGDLVDGFHESTTADDGCSRQESRVIISNDPGNAEAFQCYLVRHELTHAMGFWGHSDVFSQSIMSYARPDYDFPEVDKKAIRMLYNSGLPICSREAQTREFFAAHPPN